MKKKLKPIVVNSLVLGAAGFVCQQSDAQIVTVGGAGGGPLASLSVAGVTTALDATSLQGILSNAFGLYRFVTGTTNSTTSFRTRLIFPGVSDQVHLAAYRSNAVVDPGSYFIDFFDLSVNGATSTNFGLIEGTNFIPVQLAVVGVNGGDAIDGFLELEFDSSDSETDPATVDIITFTYDASDTDADADLVMPAGGFAVTTVVPEPSSAVMLAMGAAGVLARRRRRAA